MRWGLPKHFHHQLLDTLRVEQFSLEQRNLSSNSGLNLFFFDAFIFPLGSFFSDPDYISITVQFKKGQPF